MKHYKPNEVPPGIMTKSDLARKGYKLAPGQQAVGRVYDINGSFNLYSITEAKAVKKRVKSLS